MTIICENDKCTGCSACASRCPNQCISMIPDKEGFQHPNIDLLRCIDCGVCKKVCPLLNTNNGWKHETTAWAAINLNDTIRQNSTSGGIFTLLCEYVIDNGGAVFGAKYDTDFSVIHCYAESKDELDVLRIAKYAQSEIRNTYKVAREMLQQGRCVLFTGTPCQIAGLKAYLGINYDNLITVDMICHGVPSPRVWQYYVAYRREKDAGGLLPALINVRSKESGWSSYSVRFNYPNGNTYVASNREDAYIRSFVGNLCLRPSCYDCQFKGIDRISDITLGDYWGVWAQHPELDDNSGVSVVLLHTEKAEIIFSQIKHQLRSFPLDTKICLQENPSAIASSVKPEKREEFMKCYEREDFEMLTDRLLPIPQQNSQKTNVRTLFDRVVRKFGRTVRKIR